MNKILARWVLIPTQIVYILILPVWILVAPMSAMMFDSISDKMVVWATLIFLLIMAYPVGVILALVSSWISYRKSKRVATYIFNFIPMIWLVPALILVIIGFLTR